MDENPTAIIKLPNIKIFLRINQDVETQKGRPCIKGESVDSAAGHQFFNMSDQLVMISTVKKNDVNQDESERQAWSCYVSSCDDE